MQPTNDIKRAAEALKRGEVAVFPTDTVLGIGVASAYAPTPARVFQIKQREAGKPIAWLVGGIDALDAYGRDVPDYARNLAHAFWPGALTVVVRASDAVPEPYRSPEVTIALRMPAHATCLELLHQAGPIAATSANISGKPAPAGFADLDPAIAEAGVVLFDDGTTPAGTASTVVDCTGSSPVVLRQGAVELS